MSDKIFSNKEIIKTSENYRRRLRNECLVKKKNIEGLFLERFFFKRLMSDHTKEIKLNFFRWKFIQRQQNKI